MATVYYVLNFPGSYTATAENDEPANAPFGAPWVPVSQSVYQTELLNVWLGPNIDLDDLKIKVSRDKDREDAKSLDNATLDVGKTYAIFVPEFPGIQLGYTQIDFDLDTVFFHTETSAPWDYNGTDGFGFAQKVSFGAPGSHVIDAHVTYGGGTFTISAAFDVD